ncbi:hypothetical protein Q5H92_14930 [Hymenobacter sp. M29]|uniref:Uncharacterized protein n=1 Tax=Hymenobacter mellowenesis TaxID=3063995 RepID=A0ABT9ACT6_9BACT|nr:hypothetical protein [Hymenobacter sp. M29]MDO7847661.1 hypothetical protein [Hymenobacter sp. M29]
MHQEIKKDWLEALRSGKYTQGKYSLKKENEEGKVSYCCLGVLCDLAVRQGIVEEEENASYCGEYLFDGEETSLTPKLREWAGIETPEAKIDKPVGPHTSLMALNDSGDYTFPQIAQIIEDQL